MLPIEPKTSEISKMAHITMTNLVGWLFWSSHFSLGCLKVPCVSKFNMIKELLDLMVVWFLFFYPEGGEMVPTRAWKHMHTNLNLQKLMGELQLTYLYFFNYLMLIISYSRMTE